MIALTAVESLLQDGLAAGTYTAVSAEIGNISGQIWAHAAGQLGRDCETRVDVNTIFDLASLTKVVATTALALDLVSDGALDLDVPVRSVLPAWDRPDRRDVTVRDLLEHSSGLPAHREYFRQFTGLVAFVSAIAREPLAHPVRTSAVYSDLGFITLGAVLEQIDRAPLDHQFDAWKARHDQRDLIRYLPPADWKVRTAMTRYDDWRMRWLHGEVDDNNAAALGGVAAHAGLFGTAGAVGALARWWLRQLQTSTGTLFARRSSVAGSSRALGWDTMLPTSSCGTLMSETALGHTGFTGTSLWLDPARDRYFVLLTNRVHLPNTHEAIQQVRRSFHDAAIRDLA